MDKTVTFLYQESFITSKENVDELDLESFDTLAEPILAQWNGTILHQKKCMNLLRFSDFNTTEEYIRHLLDEIKVLNDLKKVEILFFIFQSDTPTPGLWEKNLVNFARENIPREPGVYCAHKIDSRHFIVDQILIQDGRKIIFKLSEKSQGQRSEKSRFHLSVKILSLLLVIMVITLLFKSYYPDVQRWWFDSRYRSINETLERKSYPELYAKLTAVSGDSYHPVMERAIEAYGTYLWDQSKELGKEASREKELSRFQTLANSFKWSQSASFYLELYKLFENPSLDGFKDLYALYCKYSIPKIIILYEGMQILEVDPFFLLQSTPSIQAVNKNIELDQLWKQGILRSLAFPLPGKEIFFAELIANQEFLKQFNFLDEGVKSTNPWIQGNTFRLILIYADPKASDTLLYLKTQTTADRSISEDLERLSIHPKLKEHEKIIRTLREFRDSIIYIPSMQNYLEDIKGTLEKLNSR